MFAGKMLKVKEQCATAVPIYKHTLKDICMLSQWNERVSALFNNNVNSDVTFIVCKERYPAHKLVLATASEVFNAMFFGPLKENSGEIKIEDCTKPEDFLEFLSIIYNRTAKVSWENLTQLLYLRKKYMITEKAPFIQFLKREVGIQNCLQALKMLVSMEEEELAEPLLMLIVRHINQLIWEKEFLNLDLPSLKLVLKQDTLAIKEVYLFQAVDQWCDNQVHLMQAEGVSVTKREVLHDAIYLIRFPTMSIEDFVGICKPAKLLTGDEFSDLTAAIVLRRGKNVFTQNELVADSDDHASLFNRVPRGIVLP